MSRFVMDRIKLVAWLAAFLAPVATAEIVRQLWVGWDDSHHYTPAALIEPSEPAAYGPIASADR